VASALKWGFADFDSVNVDADRKTMTAEDLATVAELLRYRPIQLRILLKALLGEEAMQKMMVEAIKIARQVYHRRSTSNIHLATIGSVFSIKVSRKSTLGGCNPRTCMGRPDTAKCVNLVEGT
jgi:hypothetical protein